jgi:hypothetical protein
MRAIWAFLNGAGSKPKVMAGSTDRGRLTLIHVLFTMGLSRESSKIGSTARQGGSRHVPVRGSQRFPR